MSVDPRNPASPEEEDALILAAAGDPAFFTDTFCIIDDAQNHGGTGTGTRAFKLWPAQFELMQILMTIRMVIILKARQLGISWGVCAYALQTVLFKSGQTVLIFSQGQTEADEMIERILKMYRRLPAWLQERAPALIVDNTGELVWANESRILSLPATQKAGRSFTASLVIMDEFAFMLWADTLYTAVEPTIADGGQLIILSTANGLGNTYHELWQDAESGESMLTPVFLPWWSRPGRTVEWYEQKLRATRGDPKKLKTLRQEYPATALEAFMSTGRQRFDADWILELEQAHARPGLKGIREEIPAALRKYYDTGALTIWRLPEPEGLHQMLIGADVAEGVEGGDFDDAVVADRETLDEWATLHGQWEPGVYAEALAALAEWYDADIGVERNNHGHTVLLRLKQLCAHRVLKGHDGKPGWLTNVVTKPMMIDHLADLASAGLPQIHAKAALAELQVYEILKNGDTSAPSGYHDDRVMSRAVLAQFARRAKQTKQGAVGGKRVVYQPYATLAERYANQGRS